MDSKGKDKGNPSQGPSSSASCRRNTSRKTQFSHILSVLFTNHYPLTTLSYNSHFSCEMVFADLDAFIFRNENVNAACDAFTVVVHGVPAALSDLVGFKPFVSDQFAGYIINPDIRVPCEVGESDSRRIVARFA